MSLLLLLAALLAPSEPITVMTYNLRYASEKGENRWSARVDLSAKTIRDSGADLIGTQEGLYHQLVDLEERLPAYRWVGLGRRGGSRGEHMAVFYRRDRFEALEYDHFWLSETPREIGSKSFDADLPRMLTWVRFRDRATDRVFVLANTHFDHRSQNARERSAHLVAEWAGKIDAATPLVLTGDFNAEAKTNLAYGLLVNDELFSDTFSTAREKGEDHGTFHGFSGTPSKRGRIDWILTRGPLTCDATSIVADGEDGRWPSDHFPVVARVRLDRD